MRGFIRAIVSAFLAVAILCSLDMHLPLLQIVAWSGMLTKHARTSGLAAALSDTFDGNHPCRLCCAIRAARSRPSQALGVAPPPRNDATMPEVQPSIPKLAPMGMAMAMPSASTEPERFPPPVPPPRDPRLTS